MKYGNVRKMRHSRAAGRSKRDLEDRATLTERTLMVALRAAKEPFGFQFIVRTAEAPTGYYVVDFRLPRRHLLVELDGQPHATEKGHWNDRLRAEAIERAMPDDLLVRFWNREVERDAAGLVRYLQTY